MAGAAKRKGKVCGESRYMFWQLFLSYYLILLGLAVIYELLVVPNYATSYGFSSHFQIHKLLSILGSIGLMGMIGWKIRQHSYTFFAYNFFLITAYLPQSVLFVFGVTDIRLYLYYSLPFLGIACLTTVPMHKRLRSPQFSTGVAIMCLSGIAIFLIGVVLADNIGGLTFATKNIIANPYEVREGFYHVSSRLGDYAVYWLPRLVLPILLVLGIQGRRISLITLSLVGFALIFVLTGLRSIAAIPFGVAAMAWVFNRARSVFVGTVFINWILGVGVLLLTLINIVVPVNSGVLSVLWRVGVRRVFFSPAILANYYFGFFSHNEKLYLSATKVNPITPYPYEESPPILIGNLIAPGTGMSANTGFLMDGYMNGGILGVFIYVLILSMILRAYDFVALPKVFLSIFAIGLYSVLSTQLTTALFTHGWGFFLLLGATLLNKTRQSYS